VSRRPALHAPARDGAVLAVPPLEDAGTLVQRNRRLLAEPGPAILGRPLAQLRDLGRRELVELARRYLDEQQEPLPVAVDPASAPLFVAGHQPELFHPGVWLKNFALAGLARRHHGLAVNLVVDNDTLKSPALRLPVRSAGGWPRLRTLPFDRWQGEVPWEERSVAAPDTFARFGDEVAQRMRQWGFEPLVSLIWPEVMRRAAGPIGAAFAAARRLLERQWGCHNLEVPLSQVSRGEAFAWFAAALLADLPRFHRLYNGVVADYRAREHIRSRNHPVPDLAAQDDWLEAPLWGWRTGEPGASATGARRSRLFVRQAGGRLHLRAGSEENWPALPAPAADGAFVEAWRDLARQGFAVRPRALSTTLFARLFLADLFVHGIGGAVYDELTDELMRRSFGTAAPAFLVLTGTRRLPLPAFPVSDDDRRRLDRQLRDIRCNPQRHLSAAQAQGLADVLAERQEWVERQPNTRAGRRRRFRELRQLTEALRPPLADEEHQREDDLQRLRLQLRANAVLQRRDYSFCLYPEATLRPFLTRVS
jgi:hypothetical protein